ncbi:hypothetical protein CRYUN_Cryun29cG0004000 [Craigia yunnanensis]
MAADLKLVCTVTVFCMLVVDSMPMATAALTCGDVRRQLFPCLSYVTSSGGNEQGPPEGCCDGNPPNDAVVPKTKVCDCSIPFPPSKWTSNFKSLQGRIR